MPRDATASLPPADPTAKVVVAMSGGVDSSVAAALLKHAGYEVVGVFMRLGSENAAEAVAGYDNLSPFKKYSCKPSSSADRGKATHHPSPAEPRNPEPGTQTSTLSLPQAPAKNHKQGCCSVNDADDARLVAAMLDIPLYVLNFKRDFGRIIDYFASEYHAGRTPNPCVRCNDWLKFGKLFDYADSIDARYVATGHYARVKRGQGPGVRDRGKATQAAAERREAGGAGGAGGAAGTGGVGGAIPRTPNIASRLLRGADAAKDQSYVLFGTPRHRLDRMLLPVGEMTKDATRRLAEAWGLPTFDKPDSQELCFVPDQHYATLVRRRAPDRVREGDIRDAAGRVLGTHRGHQHFTLGQRRGLGLSHPTPLYVVDKDPQTNVVTVGGKPDLLSTGATADQTNWFIDPPADWRPCTIQVRYNSPPVPGRVRATPEAGEDTLEVAFDRPVEAVTPGQAVVCYDDDAVLGGGWIKSRSKR